MNDTNPLSVVIGVAFLAIAVMDARKKYLAYMRLKMSNEYLAFRMYHYKKVKTPSGHPNWHTVVDV